MNDLNTINRLNAEAVEANIPNEQAKGKFVVSEFSGLHFVGYSTHATEAEAHAKALNIGRPSNPSGRSQVFVPTNPAFTVSPVTAADTPAEA